MENSSLIPHFGNTSETNLHDITYLNEAEKAGLTVIFSLLGIFGFLGNGIVVYTVISFGNYVDVPTNIFILSQALADLGTAASMLIYISHLYLWNWVLFYIYTTFVWLASLGSLLLLTFNRLVSVADSLGYARRMTPFRAKLLIVTNWLTALLVALWHLYSYLASVHYFNLGRYYVVVLLICVLLSNAYMFRESRKQARKINRQSKVVTGLQRNLREDMKSVKTLAIVGGTFLLSCLPFTLVVFVYGNDKNSVQFQRNAALWGPLMAINAVLDPVIYYFRSSEFRAFYARFRRLHGFRRRQKLDIKKTFVTFNANERTTQVTAFVLDMESALERKAAVG